MKDENKYMRFDHAAANVEAVPFVDEKIYTMRDKEQLIAQALSSRDAEVREVLEALQTAYSSNNPCWCPSGTEDKPHSEACRATAALYTKLQPKEVGDADDKAVSR